MGNNLTARISLVGSDEVKRAFRDLAKAGEDFTQKLRSADFTPMNELERSLRRAEFGAKAVGGELTKVTTTARSMAGLFGRNASSGFDKTAASASNLGNSIGITAYQAQQLTFQINDVVASLASGGSAFRILAQQGGQVTQIFGGVRGTFAALVPVLVRFAPLIAAIGAAGAGAALIRMAFGAAQSATELQKAADEAGLTADQFQRLTQASAALGLDATGIVSGIAAIGKVANEVTGSVSGGLVGALFDAGNGVAGLSKTTEDGVTKISLYGKELKGAQGIAAALGVTFKDSSGKAKDWPSLALDLARALAAIKDPALQARAATELFGANASALLPLIRRGVSGIDELRAKIASLKPDFSKADLKFADEIERNLGRASEAFSQFGKNIRTALLPVGVEASRIAVELATKLGGVKIDQSWVVEIILGMRRIREAVLSVSQSFIVQGGIRQFAVAVQSVVSGAAAGFNLLVSAAGGAARAINGVFGTEFSAGGLLAAAAVLRFSGALSLLSTVATTASEAMRLLAGGFAALGAGTAIGGFFAPLIAGAQSFLALIPALAGWPALILAAGAILAAGIGIYWDQIEAGATATFNVVISAAKSAYNYVANIFSRIAALVSGAAQTLASFVMGGGGREPQARASGGMIRGPGTGTSDSILARLSNGEYVIRAAAVKHFGPDVFHALNNLRTPKFALGGLVGGVSFRMPSIELPRFADGGLLAAAASAGPSERVVARGDIVISGERVGPFTGSEDAFEQLSRIAHRQRRTKI